jgi:hypothetical protein
MTSGGGTGGMMMVILEGIEDEDEAEASKS